MTQPGVAYYHLPFGFHSSLLPAMIVPALIRYSAVSDPARRRMLDLLVDGERPVNSLVQHFEMSRPAVSQHLRILLDAGLVTEQRHGRERRYYLAPERLTPVRDWITHNERFWDDNLNRLRQHLAKGNEP